MNGRDGAEERNLSRDSVMREIESSYHLSSIHPKQIRKRIHTDNPLMLFALTVAILTLISGCSDPSEVATDSVDYERPMTELKYNPEQEEPTHPAVYAEDEDVLRAEVGHKDDQDRLSAVMDVSTKHWEGVYMVHFAQPEEFSKLRELGLRQVVNNVTLNPDVWEAHYSAAVENDLQLIPILWGEDQSAWAWNEAHREWELCIERYPDSIGAGFLGFLRDNPRYLAQTFAVYSFHEPMNPQNRVQVSPDKQRKFWQQIRKEEFPDGSLKIYGEDITWHEECRNGVVDYDSITMYNFARSDNQNVYRPLHVEMRGTPRIHGWFDPPTLDMAHAIEKSGLAIDIYYDAVLEAPPAPDETRTKYIILIQTYAMPSPTDWCNRMPTALEMQAWATDVIGPKKDRVAGMGWYCYRQAAGHYTHWLRRDRYDEQGGDRWQAIREAALLLFME